MPVNPLNQIEPVVDQLGRPNPRLKLFSEEVSTLFPIIGTGSPEGIYEAKAGRLYVDTAGASGSVLYVKKFDDISGNRKNGWSL